MEKGVVMQYAREMIKTYPVLQDDIRDFLCLAIDEIEDGGSPAHEWGLCYNSIKELISEYLNNNKNEETTD